MNHPGDEGHPLIFMDGGFSVSHKSFDYHPQQIQDAILESAELVAWKGGGWKWGVVKER